MSDLFINNTVYYIATVIIYVIAVTFFVLQISAKARETAFSYFRKFAGSITNQKFYPALKSNIQKFITAPFNRLMRLLFEFISKISVYFRKAEEYFTAKVLPLFSEPVNIASLLIRKAYTESKTVTISVMAGLIVAFYFILTIF